MEITSIQKNIGHTPRKLRLVADMVRSMSAQEAVMRLQFVRKAAALDLSKAIKTALGNAGSVDTPLYFKTLEVNEGIKMRRFHAGTRGRVNPFKLRFSQMRIVLTDEVKNPKKMKTSKISKVTKESNEPRVEGATA